VFRVGELGGLVRKTSLSHFKMLSYVDKCKL
jgi:hypothetical protein